MRRNTGAAMLAALATLAACKKAPPAQDTLPEAVMSLGAIVATCASAVGDVQVRRQGKQVFEPIVQGGVFRVGDEVRTAPLSTARLEFLAGGGIELEESAAVVIDQAPPATAATAAGDASASAESRVDVKEGVVRGFLAEAAAGAAAGPALVVRTGGGEEMRLASKPGEKAATFRLSRREKGTEIAILQGAAAVRAAKGETTLAAGQAALAGEGELVEVSDLIDFPVSIEPGIDARFRFAPGLSVRLAWRPVEGAAGYRVQVARDLSFQHVELTRTVEGTEVAFAPPAAGMHVWRVASRDASGRSGEYGFARRLHCEEQAPRDLLVGPADGAVVKHSGDAAQVAFSWESAGEARLYRLVVASGPDLLEQRVNGTVIDGQRAALELGPAGDYWWGVYVEGADPQPIFVKPRRLSVRRVAKPKAEVPRAISNWGD